MKTPAFYRGLLLGVALLVGMPLSVAAKCPGVGPERKLLLVLDGRQTTETELNKLGLSQDSIQVVHVLCWNPADSTFPTAQAMAAARSDLHEWRNEMHEGHSWTPYRPGPGGRPEEVLGGVGVIRIVTKGLVDRLVTELYRVSEAASLSHTAQPSAVGPPTVRDATDDEVVVELNADGTQWSATLKRGAMIHQCVLDVNRSSPASTSEVQRTPTGWNPHPTADCSFTIADGEKHVLSTEG